MNPDSRPVLPEPPPLPPVLEVPVRAAGRPRSAFRGILVATLGITCLSFLGAYIASSSPVPVEPAVAAPVPIPVVELTQEQLDKKMVQVVFFLGRGQPQGATQVLNDTVAGTGCRVLNGGWGAFATRKEAATADTRWQTGARQTYGPDVLLAGGTGRAENPEIVGDKWIGASVAVGCP